MTDPLQNQPDPMSQRDPLVAPTAPDNPPNTNGCQGRGSKCPVQHYHNVCIRLGKLLRARIAGGATVEAMFERAKLGKAQQAVVRACVLGDDRPSLRQVASRLATNVANVLELLHRADNRLRGRAPDYHEHHEYYTATVEDSSVPRPPRATAQSAAFRRVIERLGPETLDHIEVALGTAERALLAARRQATESTTVSQVSRAVGISRQRIDYLEGRLLTRLRRAVETIESAPITWLPDEGVAEDDSLVLLTLRVLLARMTTAQLAISRVQLSPLEDRVLVDRALAPIPRSLAELAPELRRSTRALIATEKRILRTLWNTRRAAVAAQEE